MMSIIIKKFTNVKFDKNLMQWNMHGAPYSSSVDNKIITLSPMQQSMIKIFKNIVMIATNLKN